MFVESVYKSLTNNSKGAGLKAPSAPAKSAPAKKK